MLYKYYKELLLNLIKATKRKIHYIDLNCALWSSRVTEEVLIKFRKREGSYEKLQISVICSNHDHNYFDLIIFYTISSFGLQTNSASGDGWTAF